MILTTKVEVDESKFDYRIGVKGFSITFGKYCCPCFSRFLLNNGLSLRSGSLPKLRSGIRFEKNIDSPENRDLNVL